MIQRKVRLRSASDATPVPLRNREASDLEEAPPDTRFLFSSRAQTGRKRARRHVELDTEGYDNEVPRLLTLRRENVTSFASKATL